MEICKNCKTILIGGLHRNAFNNFCLHVHDYNQYPLGYDLYAYNPITTPYLRIVRSGGNISLQAFTSPNRDAGGTSIASVATTQTKKKRYLMIAGAFGAPSDTDSSWAQFSNVRFIGTAGLTPSGSPKISCFPDDYENKTITKVETRFNTNAVNASGTFYPVFVTPSASYVDDNNYLKFSKALILDQELNLDLLSDVAVSGSTMERDDIQRIIWDLGSDGVQEAFKLWFDLHIRLQDFVSEGPASYGGLNFLFSNNLKGPWDIVNDGDPALHLRIWKYSTQFFWSVFDYISGNSNGGGVGDVQGYPYFEIRRDINPGLGPNYGGYLWIDTYLNPDRTNGLTPIPVSDVSLERFRYLTVFATANYPALDTTSIAKGRLENVRFDRGGFIYHGRIKALADAAREAGLEF